MDKKQLLFVMLGVILIGIAILTEYASSKLTQGWTMAKNDVPGSVGQPVVVRNNFIFAGTIDGKCTFPAPLLNNIRGKIR
jgi:hypothetical protein